MENLYTIYFLDDNNTKRTLLPESAKLTRDVQTNQLKPREFEMVLDRGTSIKELDIVIVEKMGSVIFRGYVKFIEINSKYKKTITCAGMEDLLLYRLTPVFFFDKYTDITFQELLSETLTDGGMPGLLACVNSYIMPGQVYRAEGTGAIQILSGMGTDSDIGTNDLFYLGEDGLVKIPDLGTLGALEGITSASEDGFYRDAYDLYISINTNGANRWWYEFGGIFARNFKDTTIRLDGMVAAVAEKELEGSLMMDWNKIGDLICNICAAHKLFVSFRDDHNYTYIKISEEEGRFSESGVYTFHEEDLIDIKRIARDEPVAHSITGKGRGIQYYTRDNHAANTRVKIERVIDFEDEFKDSEGELTDLIDDEFVDWQNDTVWSITPSRTDLVLYPGDWVKLEPAYEARTIVKINRISENCVSGELDIDLTQHQTDISDIWQYMQDIDNGYTQNYPWEICDPVTSNAVQVDDYEEWEETWPRYHLGETAPLEFQIPDGVANTDKKPRALLALAIQEEFVDWDEAQQEIDLIGRCNVKVTFGSYIYSIPNISVGYSNAWQIPEIDITDAVIANGDDDDVNINIVITAAESSISSDVALNISGTIKFYKRAG